MKSLPTPFIAALSLLSKNVTHVFVTGAGGFLGKALCQFLCAADIKVTGFARGDYPELTQMGVNMVKGDITNKTQLIEAMQDCDLVFHTAAKAGVWGSKSDYFHTNVEGTINVIQVCKLFGIDRLIYTSTPSVTFAGIDEENINESQPYADTFLNYYSESKASAEQLVLSSNTAMLKTVALRPHLIWGPNDPHLVPRVIERAKMGKLKLVGKKDKLIDTIYIDNAAYAHILAAVKLSEKYSVCAGKVYFISNDEPITMANMLNKILSSSELPIVSKRIPTFMAYYVGAFLEWLYLVLGKVEEPLMTRFVARQLSTSHYFDITSAKNDLGYTPLVSIDDGMKKLKKSLSTNV